jgi:BioD-like phosphotransacetylase family protein
VSAWLFLGGVVTGSGLTLVLVGLVDWLARRSARVVQP